ncbi:MAG: hypothetical protein A3K19_09065 [Lentisphaerae bacterium RIFOXYB12_FULL_65_16]|nr:MAG: hypothetical protein A3K18_14090 [Lentisphaerae bacterium RIFOXYA12_64_32]OGV93249.1 MAG: hypothetical protein A3K19_09065 [Lentisphaerae bacterium RIFOXYB12_FULL_65_16]
MDATATVLIEPRDFRNRPHPNITQTVRGKGSEFAISCDFLSPSFSEFKETRTFRHPSPPFARIFPIESGAVDLETTAGPCVLRQGRVYLLPPERPFTATYHQGTRIKAFHVYISDGFGFPLGTDLDGIPEIADRRVFDAVLAGIESGHEAVWQAAVFQVVTMFCRPLFPELERRAQLSPNHRKALDLIAGSPPGELRVAEMAARLHTSRAALSKSFERQFKIPLKRHILNRAILTAKQLLVNADMTVKEIAFSLGYKEPAYFQRVFKKQVGLTPLVYRRKHRLAV